MLSDPLHIRFSSVHFGCCYVYLISHRMERFFSVRQIHTHCDSSHSIMLVSGPPSWYRPTSPLSLLLPSIEFILVSLEFCSGKTSLLFQFAFNLGLEGNVTFICNRRKLENKPPYLSQASLFVSFFGGYIE